MGRLRNLSESFKGMAFHHSTNPESAPSFTKSKTETSPSDNDLTATKELPAIAREASGSSIPHTTPPTTRHEQRSASRPTSMIYTPPSMGVGADTHIEELVPVFSFLTSHNNKLYQEGYFLKLNDLDTNGKPNADRNWIECFAQLVGTVLSLWDAAALDAAGQDGEVAPTFINLADASIKMIATLPTRNQDVQPLQNVLSVSTAGKNRYLLHFNSLHSLTQWTASIRLSMFEHGSLQELYTGSLIAGKGKLLNNIRSIMERTKFRHEDWARVRFGAGTPWRRCWCVIEPPDEKEWQRAAKTMKKRSAYDRPAYPKGDIKFYDTKKLKKATPIATITDAYSAYAIWPQSKPLIDQSTLVKVEGRITIHSTPESKTEGFVFVMPEVHPAVSGFEMMLRWLFPVYDCFHLYGRPNRLIADTLDARGLMFAMPKEKRYGYLEIIDVAALIHTEGSEKWSEREWRKQMKELTARRMTNAMQSRPSNVGSTRAQRNSMGSRNGLRYDDSASVRSTPSTRQGHQHNMSTDAVFATPPKKAITGPQGSLNTATYHNRSVSESVALSSPSKGRRQNNPYKPSRLSMDRESPEEMDAVPAPPVHRNLKPPGLSNPDLSDSRNSSDSDLAIQRTRSHAEEVGREMRQQTPPGPVDEPPNFHHQATARPQKQPDQRPEMRRNKSRLSNATLEQMVDANRAGTTGAAGIAAAAAWKSGSNFDQAPRGVNQPPNDSGMTANQNASAAMIADKSRSDAEVRPTETSPLSEPRPPFVTERSSSQHSIKRKPVPALAPPMSTLSIRGRSPGQTSNFSRERDLDSSPDYASTRKSDDAKSEKSLPKVRTGVLKTVGDPSLMSNAPPVPPKSDIPDIDFGVTQSLTPGHSRPGTAMGTLERRSPLEGLGDTTPERSSPRTPGSKTPEGLAPNDSRRSSFYGRTVSGPAHSRSGSVAWQPPQHLGRQSPGPSLSAEDFVQQRYAAVNRPSGYVPQRSVSSSTIEKVATAPKKLQKKRDSRVSSRNSLLSADYSSNLSAREQEHVARMTGGPLLQMTERSRTPDPSVGLIGAIAAREQEKRNMKEGVSGHMVQAAIAQRQHHAQAQQLHAQQAAERAYAQTYGAYSQSQFGAVQHGYGQQQQQWASRSQPQLPQQYPSWGMPVQQPPQQWQWEGQQSQHPYQGQQQQQQQQWHAHAQGQGHQNTQHQQMYGGFYQG